ncbi:MAG: gliding motility-associated ABC transporter substrate-binding protein GldG [Saprospiraceae bacterium]|nr:gliding motility-associated ABC transporter substrate-binding protein GldG [Saprospiraceae bacterium]
MARSRRSQALLQFGLFCGILLFVNILASAFFTHFDLTEEKRFTLTQPTRELLRNLDDQVYVEVLLGGDYPAGIRRLQQATREMLDDFRGINGYIDYEFTDPTLGTPEQVAEKEKAFREMGISAVTVAMNKDGQQTFKAAFPFAILHYKNRQTVVRLAENPTPDTDPEVVMNNAVSTLEYRLASAIKKIQTNVRSIILFTQGHGELDELQTADLEVALRSSYDVDRINLDSIVTIEPEQCRLLVVAKPVTAFSEKDKFKIDQYVMAGGRVLWLVDRMNATLDSMRYTRAFVPIDYPLNIEDQLFKYGVRIQPDLVLDWDCAKIELVTGQYGNSPQFTAVPWVYFPTVSPASDHPIVKSLDRVFLRFCSSIDTIRTKTPVKKTYLLRTSARSRLQFSPVQLGFDFLKAPDNPENYNKGPQTVGVLLEGIFPSNYENRVSEEMLAGLKQLGLEYRDKSVPTSMIVISDGDVALNPIQDREKKKFGPLGFNPYVQRRSELVVYANKDLLLNAIEYLIDPSGIIEARTREVKLRKLDAVRPRAEKTQWQLFNIGVPLALLALFALLFNWLRKKRFA